MSRQDDFLNKNIVSRSNAPRKISKIQFGTLQTEDIQRMSEVQVTNRSIFTPASAENPHRMPSESGPMDPRMGVSGKSHPDRCQTCQKPLAFCAGHFGYVQLELPVFHAGYFKHTLTILQCICKRCSHVMLSSQEKADLLRRIRAGGAGGQHHQKFHSNGGKVGSTGSGSLGSQEEKNPMIDMPKSASSMFRAQLFKKVVDSCKPGSQACIRCPNCGYANGVVKKVPGAFFKIVHERARKNLPQEFVQAFESNTQSIAQSGSEMAGHVKNNVHINPLRAYQLFIRIPSEDLEILWMNGRYCSPDSLVMWAVPVPPVPIRPSVPQEGQGGGSTEDDITVTMQQIVEMNNVLCQALNRGATFKMIMEDWEYIQGQVALFINGETPGIPKAIAGSRFTRGLCQRLKGKQGRFRGNLSGKRVDFSGRTVISPDPNLLIHQVGVPGQ